MGENFFVSSVLVLPANQIIDFEFIPHFVKLFSLNFLFISLIFFYYFYHRIEFSFFKISAHYQNIFLFFVKRNFFDSVYNIYLSNFFYFLSYKIFFILDKGFIEVVGFFGLSRLLFYFYLAVFKTFASGKIDNYLIISFISIVFFLFFSFILFF